MSEIFLDISDKWPKFLSEKKNLGSFRPAVNTLPVYLKLVIDHKIYSVFFLYQNSSYEVFGGKHILSRDQFLLLQQKLKKLLPGDYILCFLK